MKHFVVSLSLLLLIGCSQRPTLKKYYIVTGRNQSNIFTGTSEKKENIDSVEALTDSAAYWQGVIQLTAELKTQEMLRKKGVKSLPYTTEDLDVLDENNVSILKRIPQNLKEKAADFVNNNQ